KNKKIAARAACPRIALETLERFQNQSDSRRIRPFAQRTQSGTRTFVPIRIQENWAWTAGMPKFRKCNPRLVPLLQGSARRPGRGQGGRVDLSRHVVGGFADVDQRLPAFLHDLGGLQLESVGHL